MTGRRVFLLLAAGLIVVAFAVWVSSRRHLEHASLAGDLVLPGLESTLNTVSEVKLARGDGTHATLARGDAGWAVAERGYPADSGRVRKLLLDLGAMNVVEEKTRDPANYGALGVEDITTPKAAGTRVDLITPERSFALIVGKSSNAKSGFVRLAGAPQTFLAAPLVAVESDPKRWLDHAILDVPADRVQSFEVKPAEGPGYSAARERADQADWKVTGVPKGRELASPSAPGPIAGALAGLNLDDVQKKPATAPPQLAQARFRSFDGLELALTGHKDPTHAWVAVAASAAAPPQAAATPKPGKSGAAATAAAPAAADGVRAEAERLQARFAGWEFEIPTYRYDQIFRPLEELLQKPPEKAAHTPTRKHTGASAPPAAPATSR